MASARAVLVVEDDEDLRRMFRTSLALAGFEVEEAPDGYIALHLLDQFEPVAIVLDIGLPRVNGHMVLQEVAAQARLRLVPVVVVTGDTSFTANADVACLLRKPVSPEQLVSVLRSCIASVGSGIKS